MSLSDWLALGNLISPVAIVVLTMLHRANQKRWDTVIASLSKMKKRHKKVWQRVTALEYHVATRYNCRVRQQARRRSTAQKGIS